MEVPKANLGKSLKESSSTNPAMDITRVTTEQISTITPALP
jgi:hypothetical protein